VSDAGVRSIARAINELDLAELKVDFGVTEITDAGVADLADALPAGLQALAIVLFNTRITDESPREIARCLPRSLTSLKLEFWGCEGVGDAGVMELAKAIPQALSAFKLVLTQSGATHEILAKASSLTVFREWGRSLLALRDFEARAEAERADVRVVFAFLDEHCPGLNPALVLKAVPAELRCSRPVVLKAMELSLSPKRVLEVVDRQFSADRQVMPVAVRTDWRVFEMAGDELRGDRDLALGAIAGSSSPTEAFAWVAEELRGDLGFKTEALKRNWRALELFSQVDSAMLLSAARQTSDAAEIFEVLDRASGELRDGLCAALEARGAFDDAKALLCCVDCPVVDCSTEARDMAREMDEAVHTMQWTTRPREDGFFCDDCGKPREAPARWNCHRHGYDFCPDCKPRHGTRDVLLEALENLARG